MLPGSGPTTAQILAAFSEEVAAHGGHVTDTFRDEQRLFTRSVLPHIDDVRPGDRVRGGVALRATAEGVWVHPYHFRLVCRNGAIIAETIGSRSLGKLHLEEPDEALRSVREAVSGCCAPEVFLRTVDQVRTASERQADLALTMLSLLSRLGAGTPPGLMSQILEQFSRDEDQSQFGLANAVTAVARDTPEPALRWDLEEFGGGVAIGIRPHRPTGGERAAGARQDEAVCVS